MFKVREIIVQTGVILAGFALKVYEGRLHFGDEQVATLSPDETTVGSMLTVNSNGSIVSIDDISTLTIHVDSQNGSDENGYGNEDLPFRTLSHAINVSSDFKMFQSVKFVLYGDMELSGAIPAIQFPSEVTFIGNSQQEISLSLVTNGIIAPTINIDSRARVVFDGVSLSVNGDTTDMASIVKGRMSEVVLIHNSIFLPENTSLIESLYNIDVRMINTSVDNSEEKIFINNGGSRVSITGDSASSIVSMESSDVCYYVATDDEGKETNISISLM